MRVTDASEPVLRIRIAADYAAFPVWPESPEARSLRLPDDLYLPPELLVHLTAWAEVHDRARTARSNYEWDHSVADEHAWIEDGRALASRVQDHLGDAFEVTYPYQ